MRRDLGLAQAVATGACDFCVRRSWLQGELGPVLDYVARDRARLLELLSLADVELINAIGGRRKNELIAQYERFDAAQIVRTAGAETICRHDDRYPASLRAEGAPHMLHITGGAREFEQLSRAAAVAHGRPLSPLRCPGRSAPPGR